MDLFWIIYLIDNFTGNPFPHVGILLVYLGFISFLILPTAAACDTVVDGVRTTNSEDFKAARIIVLHKPRYLHYVVVIICVIGTILNMFMPSKDTAYKMLAAYGVTEIVKNDKVQEIGGKSLEVLEKAMDSYLKDSEEVQGE